MKTIFLLLYLVCIVFFFGFIAIKEAIRIEKYRQDFLSAIRDIANSLKDN